MIIDNQRPGVYSRYDISSVYTTPRSGSYAAVAAKANGAGSGTIYEITGMSQLYETLSPDTDDAGLFGCVQILLQSGVSKVLAVAVENDDYDTAFALLEPLENIGALVCDCSDPEDLNKFKESVQRSSDALRERIGYCALGTAADAVQNAEALNCERIVMCCPAVTLSGSGLSKPVYGASALAGRVLAQNDCTYSFSGEPLAGVDTPDRLSEQDIQSLLASGVTVLELCGGAVECVRALTTRTRTSGQLDYSLRGLNTILCIDNVMQNVRASLKALLRGSKISGSSLQTIQSQVAVTLSERKDAGVIESFDTPKTRIDASDPTVCDVELAFRVAHVVSQIFVTAHIQI